jgi:hypothetical protein
MQQGCEGNVMLSVNDALLGDLVREANEREIPLHILISEIVESYVAAIRLAALPSSEANGPAITALAMTCGASSHVRLG